jgi:hypothetical protein
MAAQPSSHIVNISTATDKDVEMTIPTHSHLTVPVSEDDTNTTVFLGYGHRSDITHQQFERNFDKAFKPAQNKQLNVLVSALLYFSPVYTLSVELV